MLRGLSCRIAVAALFAGAAAVAQTGEDSQPDGDGEIVVNARPEASPDEFQRAVDTFVEDLGEPGPFDRISRWGEGVCPRVSGLPKEFGEFIAARIKDVAAQVGAPIATECGDRPNVQVIFTRKPQELADDVRRNHKLLLGYHAFGEAGELATFRPPMKSWYVTQTIFQGYNEIDIANGPVPPGAATSRLRLPHKSRFAFALIVVDTNLVDGEEIGPVADKIAMLALSNAAPYEGCSRLPSVLDLLEPECGSGASGGLTEYDQTYLKALYAFDGDEVQGAMRNAIAGRIIAELGPPAGDAASR